MDDGRQVDNGGGGGGGGRETGGERVTFIPFVAHKKCAV